MAPVMSIRCITVPPRMKPSGLESFGRTTWTVSDAESCQRFALGVGILVTRLRHSELAAIEIERDAVRAQELVADDAADLEAEQDARRLQVQHHHREVVVVDLVELEVDAGHQERVAIPTGRAVDAQRDLARDVVIELFSGRRAD